MHKVDIIILSWDRSDDTLAAIESACGQTEIDLQVYVVDQNSAPEHVARVQRACDAYENVTLCLNDRNLGCPGGRNLATSLGQGDYIVALDNDAVFADRTVCARAAAEMHRRTSLGALAFRIERHDRADPDESSWAYYPLMANSDADSVFAAMSFVGAGHMLRRSAFEQVGAYDDWLFFMNEELDLSHRMISAGYEIEYRRDLVVQHKVTSERRMSWSAQRFEYFVRNLLYVKLKVYGFGYRTLEEALVLFVGGIRAGNVCAACRGLWAGFAAQGKAHRARRANPYYHVSPAFAAYRSRVAQADPLDFAESVWPDRNRLYRLYAMLRWQTNFAGMRDPKTEKGDPK
ncbi:MAG: glycosyltransferase [Pseudomonadota bacterium]